MEVRHFPFLKTDTVIATWILGLNSEGGMGEPRKNIDLRIQSLAALHTAQYSQHLYATSARTSTDTFQVASTGVGGI